MDGILLQGLLFIGGMFVCVAIIAMLEAGKFITIRYQSGYFFFAVVIEILFTLLFFKL